MLLTSLSTLTLINLALPKLKNEPDVIHIPMG
ncbi:hypothetical protein AVENLUH8758_02309 [Acinetobacter venetianus]|nr:hypothetical protein AVENLUH8758_02309 [Acinetobacter venetianus]